MDLKPGNVEVAPSHERTTGSLEQIATGAQGELVAIEIVCSG